MKAGTHWIQRPGIPWNASTGLPASCEPQRGPRSATSAFAARRTNRNPGRDYPDASGSGQETGSTPEEWLEPFGMAASAGSCFRDHSPQAMHTANFGSPG